MYSDRAADKVVLGKFGKEAAHSTAAQLHGFWLRLNFLRVKQRVDLVLVSSSAL